MSATDIINLDAQLTDAERKVRDDVASFVDNRVRPNIGNWFENAIVPTELFPEMAELGLFGMHLKGYGCAGKSAVEYGLAVAELEAGDSGLRTIVSVQGSLAMSAIYKNGNEEQKQRHLPSMATGETIGAFGLTEPDSGSDPASMTTRAEFRDGRWVLNGRKRWIGLANIADIVVIWAKAVVPEDAATAVGAEPHERERVRGFIVPTDSLGFRADPIDGKLSLRASVQADIYLEDVELDPEALLPLNPGLRGPFSCLNEARYGISWGVTGAARDSIEAALQYSKERIQFDRPLASFQLTQKKLADMTVALNQTQLLALHLGRAKDAGTLELPQISMAKLANTRTAIEIARTARTIFGGNGVTTDYSPLRHAINLESVRTYEGTDEVHTLILGQALTGESAFA